MVVNVIILIIIVIIIIVIIIGRVEGLENEMVVIRRDWQ